MTQRFECCSPFFSEKIFYVLLCRREILISPVLFTFQFGRARVSFIESNPTVIQCVKLARSERHTELTFQDNSLAVITVCRARHELLEMIYFSLHSYYPPRDLSDWIYGERCSLNVSF